MQRDIAAPGMHEPLADFVQSSATCLLLVHRDIATLECAVDEAWISYQWPRVSVGRELSAALLPEVVRHRSLAARQWARA